MEIRGNEQNKYWSNRAHTYGLQYGLDRDAVKVKIRRKVRLMQQSIPIDKVDSVIEFGCGTGLYTKEFCLLNSRLLSTDISKDMLQVAKEYCPQARYQEIDARKMPLPDRSYDIVLSSFLLQHAETELVLPEMHRILKKGGYFGAFVPNILNPLHYSRARVGFMRKILHENSQSEDFNRWKWVKLLESYGFKNIQVKPIEFTSPYFPVWLLPLATKTGEIMESLPVIKEFAGTLLIVARKS